MSQTAEKKVAPAAAAPKTSQIKVLKDGPVMIALIDVVSNVRSRFDEAALKELTENVRQLGVISPITLRPGSGVRYELVAGERRLRAAKAAGLQQIPARVLELNDQQALEYQAAENIHRKDLTPIEEARAYQALTKAKNGAAARYTVAELASVVRKSEVHVHRMMSLLNLPKQAVDAIEEGVLTPAHGLQILRVPKDKQDKFVKMALQEQTDQLVVDSDDYGSSSKTVKLGVMTAKALQLAIDNEVGTSLTKAQFPKDIVYANELACAKCPLNAANQGMLFDGAEEGRCLNRPCFDKKTEQFYRDLQAEGAKKWSQLEFVGRGHQDLNYERSIEGLPGNAMLTEAEQNHAVIKKLFAAKPHKLGYAVVLPAERGYWSRERIWKKAKLVMVVRDPSMIGGMRTDKIVDCTEPKKEKKRTATRSSSESVEKPKNPKAEFIEAAIEAALSRAVAAKAMTMKPTLDDWREIAERLWGDIPGDVCAAILGKEGGSVAASELSKLTESQAMAFAILGVRLGWNSSDNDYKKLGVDVAGVKKKAAAEAQSAWAKREADEKAKAAKK